MGGKSSSTSSNAQTTQNTQTISSETIGVEGNELAVVAGDGSTVSLQQTTTDLGALDKASDIADASLGLAGESLQVNADVVDRALDFSEDFGGASLDLASDSLGTVERGLDASLDFGSGALSDVLSFAERTTQQSKDLQQGALSTLSTAITKVSDASRSDTTETFRRIALYGSIVIAIIGVAYFVRKR